MSFVCTLIFKFLLGVLGNNALQFLQKRFLALIAAGHGIGGVTDFLRGGQFWNPEGGQVLDMEIAVLIYIGAVFLLLFGQGLPLEINFVFRDAHGLAGLLFRGIVIQLCEKCQCIFG